MPRVESFDGTELFYEDIGEGRPVVMVHGWATSHEFFEPQITALCDSYRVIAVDLRGHGKSGKPGGDYGYDTYSKDIEAILSELDVEDAALVGWSIGGGIALRYVATYGDRISQLGLVSPAATKFLQDEDYPHGLPEEEVQPLLEAEKTNRPDFRRTVLESATHRELDDATMEWFWNLSMQMPRWAGVLSYEALLDEDMTDDARQIDIPTRIFQGDQDTFCPASGAHHLADLIEEATVDVIEYQDVGHTLMWEAEEQLTDDLEAFLNEH
jgi:pimeloyl-ACP methyl ester carboxylesterase